MALIVDRNDAKDASQALLAGFEVCVEKLVTTEKQLMINHGEEDSVYVRGAPVPGRSGYFEFQKFESKERQAEREARWILINACLEQRAPFVIYPDIHTNPLLGHMVVAPAEAPDHTRGPFYSIAAARKFCVDNGLPFTQHKSRPEKVAVFMQVPALKKIETPIDPVEEAPAPAAESLNAAQVALQILEVVRKEHPDLIADNMPADWGMIRLRRELSDKLLIEDSCNGLVQALNRTNSVVSAWSVNDLDFLDELDELEHLNSDQLLVLKESVLASCSDQMRHQLWDLGGNFLLNWWRANKDRALEKADLLASPEATGQQESPSN